MHMTKSPQKKKPTKLEKAEDIVPAYKAAMEFNGSTLLVEYVEKY